MLYYSCIIKAIVENHRFCAQLLLKMNKNEHGLGAFRCVHLHEVFLRVFVGVFGPKNEKNALGTAFYLGFFAVGKGDLLSSPSSPA